MLNSNSSDGGLKRNNNLTGDFDNIHDEARNQGRIELMRDEQMARMAGAGAAMAPPPQDRDAFWIQMAMVMDAQTPSLNSSSRDMLASG